MTDCAQDPTKFDSTTTSEYYGVELDSFDLELLANATVEVNKFYTPPRRQTQSNVTEKQIVNVLITDEILSGRSRGNDSYESYLVFSWAILTVKV
eukprot:m.343588 g.343588  ORF g.343588 m.343588 type:complete len:95 (-) comp16550_c0_seq75:2491-2775(-)